MELRDGNTNDGDLERAIQRLRGRVQIIMETYYIYIDPDVLTQSLPKLQLRLKVQVLALRACDEGGPLAPVLGDSEYADEPDIMEVA